MPAAIFTPRRRRPRYAWAALAAALLAICALATSWSPARAAGTDAADRKAASASGSGKASAHTTAAGAASRTKAAEGDAPPDSFWGDTSTIPAAKNVMTLKILNRTNGKYPDDQVFWTYNGETHSIAEQPYFDMPVNSAGRMYFHLGTPDSKYADFIEFTVGDKQFNGNTTRVDAFALKLAMRLHAHDGYDTQVGEDYQTFQQDRDATFKAFSDAVPEEFKSLATVQAPYSIPAPGSVADFRAGGKYADYFTSYAKSAGVDAPTSDIFGCAGTLAGDPGKCSALNRHVAQLPEDEWSKPANFYKDAPANYYAKFWHDHSINNLAYGFPYDDYAGQSSFVSHADPQWLEVAVGW